MSRAVLGLLAALPVLLAQAQPGGPLFWDRLEGVIQRHLGRPYVWGTSGLKSFDCSGFVWRVLLDNGILIKRTTARKLYLSLPATTRSERLQPGDLVFFDNLQHCGIVRNRTDFYHAQLHRGTNLSEFDPFWRPKICGFRKMPSP